MQVRVENITNPIEYVLYVVWLHAQCNAFLDFSTVLPNSFLLLNLGWTVEEIYIITYLQCRDLPFLDNPL